MARTYIANTSSSLITSNILTGLGVPMWALSNTGTTPAKIKRLSITKNPQTTSPVGSALPVFKVYRSTIQSGILKDSTWFGVGAMPAWNCGVTPFDNLILPTSALFTFMKPVHRLAQAGVLYNFNTVNSMNSILDSTMKITINPGESLVLQGDPNSIRYPIICSVTIIAVNATGNMVTFSGVMNISDGFFINVPIGEPKLSIVSIAVDHANFYAASATSPKFSVIKGEYSINGKLLPSIKADDANVNASVKVYCNPTLTLPGYSSGVFSNTTPTPLRRFTVYPGPKTSTSFYFNQTLDIFNANTGSEIVLNPNESIAVLIDNSESLFWPEFEMQTTWIEVDNTISSGSVAVAYIS